MIKMNFSIRYITGCTLFLLLVVCMIMASCTDHTFADARPVTPVVSEQGKLPVRITIHTAAAAKRNATRSQIAEETKISEVKVVVYHDDQYAYTVAGSGIVSNSTSTTFEVQLRTHNGKVKLCLFANANDYFPPDYEWDGIASLNLVEASINDLLIKNTPDTIQPDKLPMYGEYVLADGITYDNMNEITGVNMLRAVARVDIILDEGVENFTLESVQVFRAASQIAVVPGGTVDYTAPVVTQPTVPAGTTTRTMDRVTATGNKVSSQVYIPESEAVPVEQYKEEAVCIIIGGRFTADGESGTMNYYRIGFRSGGVIGEVLRNHRYVFRIQGVNRSSWTTPEEAAQNASENITTILEKWDDDQTNEITDGVNYLGYSSRKLSLKFRAGSAGYINIRTNYDNYTMCWVDEKGQATSLPSTGALISDSNFAAEIIDPTTGAEGEHLSSIRISTLNQNNGSDQIKGYLLITAGLWNLTIAISQLCGGDYNDFIINILSLSTSITDYGNLGGSYPGGSGGASSAVKPLLLNYDNFGPGGTVPVRYIGMDNIPTSTSATDLESTLTMYDILHVMTGSDPTAEKAQVIVDWLKASPNRVLFVSRDRDANNTQLLTKLDAMDSWTGGGTGSTSGRTFQSVQSAAADYFLQSGPFGGETIANFNSNNTYWRSIAPGTTLYNRVVPVIESTNTAMGCVVGIDIENRVVYVGHPWLYQSYSGGMGTNGQVESGLDRLFANIYAWAIEEVIVPGKLGLN